MEQYSFFISVIALLFAALAVYWSRKQYLFDSELSFRRELSESILLFKKTNDAFYLMERERQKTGQSLEDHELELFEIMQTYVRLNEKITAAIIELLQKKSLKVDKKIISDIYLAKSRSEALLEWS